MKVWIRDKEGLEAVYWIKRKRTVILGWFTAPKLVAESVGLTMDVPYHIHFTYPLDGDYHFSLKFKDPHTGIEVYQNVYCDRITRKKITAAGPSKSVSRRVGNYGGLAVLMPEHRPRRLDDYLDETAFFSFATSALPIRDGIHIRKSKIRNTDDPGEDDLVIDVTPLRTGTVNISAHLVGKGVFLAWPPEKYSWSRCDDSKFPNVLLRAIFWPDTTAQSS
ncbi:MAG TPA: hypothetical protein VFU08_09930 [Candidatus Udaeobacter sp.]|nr:hypothetical protein [Candidatus Udaeobacter sp.]